MTLGVGDGRKTGTRRWGIGIVALLLAVLALVWALTLAWAGLAQVAGSEVADIGLLCGLMSAVGALFVRGPIFAALISGLAFVAVLAAGPTAGFFLLFGTMTGLGGLFAFIGTAGEPGTADVGLQSPIWLGIGILAALFFLAQAFAILRAIAAWERS